MDDFEKQIEKLATDGVKAGLTLEYAKMRVALYASVLQSNKTMPGFNIDDTVNHMMENAVYGAQSDVIRADTPT